MNSTDLLQALFELPADERVGVLKKLADQLARTVSPKSDWDPSEEKQPEIESTNQTVARARVAAALTDVAYELASDLWVLVMRGELDYELRRRVAWPCVISCTSGREDYVKTVAEELRRRHLGSDSETTVGPQTRLRGNGEPKQVAEILQAILRDWRGVWVSAPIARLAKALASEYPHLYAEVKALPPFTQDTANDWWKIGAFPLWKTQEPAMEPQKRGKRKKGEALVGKAMRTRRAQVKKRFVDFAPGYGKRHF